jgi:hypothetical protein
MANSDTKTQPWQRRQDALVPFLVDKPEDERPTGPNSLSCGQ